MAVLQDDIAALSKSLASFISDKKNATALLTTLVGLVNSMPNGAVKTKVVPATTALVNAFNLMTVDSNVLSATMAKVTVDSAPATTPAPSTSGWQALKLGAGGLISNIQFANDGTAVIRTDTYGAYVWDSALLKWRQLVLSTTIPTADLKAWFGGLSQGIYSVAIAPGNSSRIYMMLNGYILRSDNKGVSFVRTAFTQVTGINPNVGQKGFGPYLSVDPSNPDICYASTPSNGCWKTLNAGVSWSQVTAVGTATDPSGHTIVFDRSSAVTGGATQGIFISTFGTGVYHSANGGSTWTLLNTTGMPTTHAHTDISSTGRLAIVDGSTNNLHFWSGGVWTQDATATGLNNVAFHPTNANFIIAHEHFDSYFASTDGGASWNRTSTSPPTRSIPAGEPGWLGTTPWNMAPSNVAFDPSDPTKLYAADGVGVWFATNPPTTAGATPTWFSHSIGIEQLVADQILAPEGGGAPIALSWDRAIFRLGNLSSFPSSQQWDTARPINRAAHADYCAGTPSFMAAIVNSNSEQSGFSTDGGLTWTKFTSAPTGALGKAGCIAINSVDPTNMIWVPQNDSDPWYTKDGGVTWQSLGSYFNTNFGVALSPAETGWGHNQVFNHFGVCADRVNANTFYLHNYGPAGDGVSAPAGVYKSTNKGDTWQYVYQGNITSKDNQGYGHDFFHVKLRAVSGHAGNLFFASGTTGGATFPSPAIVPFKRSTDGGSTWQTVANVQDVWDFGFGASAPGQSYPAIYIVGWVSGDYGIWASDDNCASWTKLTTFPFDWLDSITTIDADKAIYRKVYVGFTGSGYGVLMP